MTKYYPYGVSLSKGQLEKLSRAYNNKYSEKVNEEVFLFRQIK